MRVICKFIIRILFFLFSAYVTNSLASLRAGNDNFQPEKSRQETKYKINEIREFIQFYSQQGNQRTGSAADKRTLSWMEKLLKNDGYQIKFQSFPFIQTTQSKATITFKMLDYRTLEGMTLYNSEATHSDGLAAQLGEVDQHGYVPIFHYFVMLPNENATRELIRNNHREFAELLSSNKYPAVVVITQANKRGLAPFNINLHNYYHIPIILLSSSFGNLLETEAKINKKVFIKAENKQKESVGYNLIATLKGKNPNLKPLIIMVSRNTWWRGSAERGTGIAAFLAVAKKISFLHPQRSVIMVAVGGNELGHLGYSQFLREYKSLVNAAYAWIYIGANIAGQPPSALSIKTNDRKLYHRIENILTMQGFTNAMVAMKSSNIKIPFVSFAGFTNECYHLRCDKWPTTVSIDNEMAFIKMLDNLASYLSR